jgi:hypothetical protein
MFFTFVMTRSKSHKVIVSSSNFYHINAVEHKEAVYHFKNNIVSFES